MRIARRAATVLPTILLWPGFLKAQDAINELDSFSLNWAEPAEAVSPPGRCCAGVTYDPATHTTLMFGGFTNPTFLNDTWIATVRDGWTKLSPAASPSPRQGPGLVYDGAVGNVLLFGGKSSNGTFLNDTWTWDGVTWTQQFPPVSPPARELDQPGMAYDAPMRRVVLFGGITTGGTVLGDTWTWDGIAKTWRRRFPASSPPPRRGPTAYDEATNTVVLFGGDDPNANIFYNDTWTWDGTTWTQMFPASSPSPRAEASMAYDDVLKAVMIFGGTGTWAGPSEEYNDLWAWDGNNWTELHPAVAPPARYAAVMNYDDASLTLLLFAGFSTYTRDDTWLFGWVPAR